MKETQYLVTVKQLAQIVKYCVRMTIAGSSVEKDWTHNVEEAIDLLKSRTIVLTDKVPLEPYEPVPKLEGKAGVSVQEP